MIIGLSGKKGSGKSTLADGIKKYSEDNNKKCIELAFAYPLKLLCSTIFGLKLIVFSSYNTKESNITDLMHQKNTTKNYKIRCIANLFGYSNLEGKMILLKIYRSIGIIGITCNKIPSENIIKTYLEINKITPRELMQKTGSIFRSLSTDIWVNLLEKKINTIKSDIIIISDVRYMNEFEMIRRKKNSVLIKINRCSIANNKFSYHESENSLDKNKEFDIILNNDSSESYFTKMAVQRIFSYLT